MKTVQIRIEGVSPLLQHRFNVVDVDLKSKKKNLKKNEDVYEDYLYMNDGKVCQPAEHIIAALKRAGAKFQIPGQGKLTYKNLVGSGVIIINPYMIEHENQNWIPDRRSVVVQRARIIRTRPKFEEWALSFQIEYDDEEIPKEVINELLVFAGKRIGIGDYRPEKGGLFGRFIVTEFK